MLILYKKNNDIMVLKNLVIKYICYPYQY